MKHFSLKLTVSFIFAIAVFSIKAAAQTPEEIKQQMIADWERAKSYTQDYLNTMPANKYDLRPTDSIRTFSGQMLHLASANAFFGSTVFGKDYPFGARDVEHAPTAQSKDSVVYFVNASYDYVINNLKNTDASALNNKVKAFNTEMPEYVLLLKAFEHQTHHRGQTTIYLRLAGVKPPQERLF